jgi:hypothetical protein
MKPADTENRNGGSYTHLVIKSFSHLVIYSFSHLPYVICLSPAVVSSHCTLYIDILDYKIDSITGS